jgi:putative Mn2+ efflux pump MntP
MPPPFERRHQPLLPRAHYRLRLLVHLGLALSIVALALSLGVAGYHWLGGLAWIDALVNAAMILGGMGPVDALRTDSGKVFAACYALFSGLMFIVIVAVLLAPVVHRFLHHFHLEPEGGPDQDDD